MASPAPPSSASRRQRASHTVVSPTAHHNSHHHHQQPYSNQGHTSLLPVPHHSNNADSHTNSQPSAALTQNPQYPDVYAHPAAVAYSAAHPRRTIPKFGPYLLLQTLGEGEFGKVKLGLHSQWGEEVAVKLIRRGNVDSTVRMSKVEREIEVLKTLKHPNIVRLYDVIETDKYIGIILEYASGGELFDHILAHRYLREKDAARLFSQLISGVWYIHQKKIVHRDLKLENLLLDRNRNVIITDFGFANRFEHKSDDLMQTSCGSPCYAAPELVISEGLYVGSAVDIWSCGVILYAMLAGYLPFDDDPANPDGDNINLLYKYIVSTPLSFPDYISAEARDLLSLMLVPDPTRRTSLEGVMRHPWLSAYWVDSSGGRKNNTDGGPPVAFGRTVEELEKLAMDGHQQKRIQYQKQMRQAAAAAAAANSGAGGSSGSNAMAAGGSGTAVAPTPGRTQSHRPTEHRDRERDREREREAIYAQQQQQQQQQSSRQQQGGATPRSRSVQPEYLYDSSVDQSLSMSPGGPAQASASMPLVSAAALQQPATPTANAGNAKGKAPKVYGSPAAAGLSDDDPFAFTSGPPSNGAVSGLPPVSGGLPPVSGGLAPPGIPPAQASNGNANKSPGGDKFRHTIQVEYDAPKGRRGRSGSQSQGQRERQQQAQQQQQQTEKRSPPKPLPSPPPVAASSPAVSTTTATAPSAYRPPPATASSPPSAAAKAAAAANANGLSINVSSAPAPAPVSAAPTQASESTFTNAPTTPDVATGTTGSTSSIKPPSVSGQQQQGHKKGKSSVDRMGLGKIFGGLGSGAGPNAAAKDDGDVTPSASVGSVVLTPSATASVSASEEDKESKESNGTGGSSSRQPTKKASRRNTLTVMVEPFRSVRGKKDKESKEKDKDRRMASTPVAAAYPHRDVSGSKSALPGVAGAGAGAGAMTLAVPTTAPVPGPVSAIEPSPGGGGAFSPSQEFGGVPTPGSGMQASTSKAKKVMQWFRTKSKGRESVGYGLNMGGPGGDEEATPTPTHPGQGHELQQQQQEGKYKRGYSASSSTVNQQEKEKELQQQQPATAAPQVVVTTPSTPRPSGAHTATSNAKGNASKTPIQPLRTASAATDASASAASISASSFVTRFRNSVTAVGRERNTSTTEKHHHHHHHHQNQHAHPHGQAGQQAPHPYSQLRIHHGAVDQTTITTRPPPEVMAHVKKVLEGMGVEAQMESEYKVRCVRVKKKKDTIVAGQEGEGQGQLAVVTMMGSAASNGVDKRGLPLPSPSAFSGTGGMLRGLLMRRQSSQVSTHGPASSSTSVSGAAGNNSLAFDDETSVVVGEPLNMNGQDTLGSPISPSPSPLTAVPAASSSSSKAGKGPAYGDPNQDAGDEVRFSVELTRLDRLNDTYSLDIRRLKGNLRSYKFLYDTLRERADLSAAH
ncbi:Fatty acyl-CoA synthetase and RNA processing-associated kinase 1 [Psilocybe cubensis]|uniref:non-specific serine/threonine protein kinase n=2 Tax=Psilocybe cubensis TaxID=181762 RepID=A0A8H8CFV6_PSICU|nr:Fatty acyl-CoA synthetase and RNA processing-associated kinase 1 [Psilocybe cubensis]KAH9477148.1 Fatty acyl-CoA synthetase and RNA processing-associated kinase 1 [Psilocybe cubensis]